jgi:uncharacterized protein
MLTHLVNNANAGPAGPRCKLRAASLIASMVVGAVLSGMNPARAASAGKQSGPSFDCKKAATETEKTICGDPALARLDRDVDQLVTRLLHKYDSAYAQEQLFELQRKWERARDGQCTGLADMAGCLKERYRAHYDHLKHWTPSK